MWRAEVPDHLTALFVVLGRVGHDEAGLPAVGPHVFRTGLGRSVRRRFGRDGTLRDVGADVGSCARVNSSRYPVTTYVFSATCTTGVLRSSSKNRTGRGGSRFIASVQAVSAVVMMSPFLGWAQQALGGTRRP